MGYTTYFSGEIEVEPPLSAALVAEINAYNREDHRDEEAAGTAPGIWCQWIASDDGHEILWDDGEKFYDSPLWMTYVINRWLVPNGHVGNGKIFADGEESDDHWMLEVINNEVFVRQGRIVYGGDDG